MSESSTFLKAIEAGKAAPAYLITGEEYLVRKVSDELVGALLPGSTAALNLAIMDGTSAAEVARELATLAMLPGRKVVLVREPEFLAPQKRAKADALAKVKEAWTGGKRRLAANRALALLARAGLGPRELSAASVEQLEKALGTELADTDASFLRDIGSFCMEEGLTSPEGGTAPLEALLEKGLPKGHHLVIEATQLDAAHPMVKRIARDGVLIERKVERELKKLDIHQVAAELLAPLGKRLDGAAEALLKDYCGAEMRLLLGELEKLATYVPEKQQTITEADVRAIVSRSREEEFLELSNAIQSRDLRTALRYVEGALGAGEAPLRLSATLATMVRNLLESRARWARAGFGPRTSKGEFDAKGLPILAAEVKERGGRPPHPYAAWMNFQASMRFELMELVRAHLTVARADMALKSGANPRMALESILFALCRAA